MRRFASASALAIAIAFLLSGCGGSSGPALRGTYVALIGDADSLNGVWTIRFASNGTETVVQTGAVVVTGRPSFNGQQVTFQKESGRLACPGPGTYSWTMSANTLQFHLVNDSCSGRRTVLSYPFQIVSGTVTASTTH